MDGIEDHERLADMARAKLRNKIPDLRLALEGHIEEHHRFQLARLLEQLRSLDAQIARFGQQIAERSRPFGDLIERLSAIPGVDKITASALIAEIGDDMKQFPTAQHLASWAGICPGNNESGGKTYSGKTRKGNRWLRRVLCQAGWAASHTHNTYLAALFRRVAARRGKNRALIAVAHSILIAVYHMLARNQDYQELGGDYFDRLNPAGLRRYLVKRLERLGHRVTLEPIATRA